MDWIGIGIASILGVLTGLGIGGGSLLLLWLTYVVGFTVQEARSINLLFFLPSALVCSLLRIRQHLVSPKALLPAVIPGSIAAAVCAWFSPNLRKETLQMMFAVLMIISGIRELRYKK